MPNKDNNSSSKIPFHPAFGVNNIKNYIPLILDQTNTHYASWVELFRIQACAYNVLDHNKPKSPRPADIDEDTCATAQELWDRLSEIFQDNKATCAVYLEEQFTSTRLDAFANVTRYCARLKNLADQLTNVGNPVSEQNMVLQLVSGLTKGDYDTIATIIQQSDLLPTFNKAQSQLLLEETLRNKQDTHAPQARATQTVDSPNLRVHSQTSGNNNTSRNFRSDHGDQGNY
ncbi:uncharacterized protein LOC111902871 [Lactuca sativa]|uniref:uncharacterized protein LOC111902871 n=1 Tax=Lactuca sativa TaxID=4236 RepID=UPI000CD9D6A8|nr:uncharacterized protein LOC111902871 [Lactuca sativa]